MFVSVLPIRLYTLVWESHLFNLLCMDDTGCLLPHFKEGDSLSHNITLVSFPNPAQMWINMDKENGFLFFSF